MDKKTWWLLFLVGLFAIAMGYMESAVVVYLRTIYYPAGFSFPLKALDSTIAITELFREAATMVMLLCVGLIAAKKPVIRFAVFLFAFAVWDIFYYVFLRFLTGWPASLLEWDILFLIPVTWVGPVLAPVINSLTMIALAVMILFAEGWLGVPKISALEWTFLLSGSLITIVSYTLDYLQYLARNLDTPDAAPPVSDYVPLHFNWFLFGSGEILFCIALYLFWKRELTGVTRNA